MSCLRTSPACLLPLLLLSLLHFHLAAPQPLPPPLLRSEVPPPLLDTAQTPLLMSEFALRTANFSTVMQTFYRLPPPDPPLQGEYLAELLDAGTGMNNMLATLGFGNPVLPGFWVGKGFCLEGENGRSKGYNLFMEEEGGREGRVEGSRLVRKYRMTTRADVPSVWDGKPSLELDYRGERHYLGRMGMKDEVREVAPGLYLGLGSFGMREMRKEQPLPFLLRGPFHTPLSLGEVMTLDRGGGD